jgi:hypothetical protein
MQAETPFRWLSDVSLIPMAVALCVFSCLTRILTHVLPRFGVVVSSQEPAEKALLVGVFDRVVEGPIEGPIRVVTVQVVP